MDSRLVHETCGEQWRLDLDVSTWMYWTGRLLGRGIRETVHKVIRISLRIISVLQGNILLIDWLVFKKKWKFEFIKFFNLFLYSGKQKLIKCIGPNKDLLVLVQRTGYHHEEWYLGLKFQWVYLKSNETFEKFLYKVC